MTEDAIRLQWETEDGEILGLCPADDADEPFIEATADEWARVEAARAALAAALAPLEARAREAYAAWLERRPRRQLTPAERVMVRASVESMRQSLTFAQRVARTYNESMVAAGDAVKVRLPSHCRGAK